MELSTQDSGLSPTETETVSEMVTAHKSGLMDRDMKDTGKLIKPTDKENSFMLMVTFMKANGSKTKLMETEPTLTLTVPITTEIGSTINSTVTEWSHGQMVLSMRATTSTVKRKAKEN